MRQIVHTLSERQNHRCCYCGHRMVNIEKHQQQRPPRNAVTREHVIAKSDGGNGHDPNVAAACKLCNELRGNIEPSIFSGLQKEWFRRDPTLRERWHTISREEYYFFKLQCLEAQERHLRRRSKTCPTARLRHQHLLYHHGRQLQLRA